MAQRVEVLLIDDIDGSDASETVTFGLDGSAYEIDLSEKNAEKLRSALAQWVDSARTLSKSGAVKGRKPLPTPGARKQYLAKVREWAAANGKPIPQRGRLPRSLEEEYEATLR